MFDDKLAKCPTLDSVVVCKVYSHLRHTYRMLIIKNV